MNLIKSYLKIILTCLFLTVISPGAYANNEAIIGSTVYYVEKNSYFYKDSAFEKIFEEAINSINRFSDEIFIQILEISNRKLKINVKVGDTNEVIILKKNNNLIDVGKNLNSIINLLEEKGIIDDKNNPLAYHVANAVLQEIDDYSSIIEPDDLNQFLIETKGSFGGIGIVVGIRDEKLTIISPIEGTPAFKAGVKANDVIRRIESSSADGISLEQAIKLLRGEKGTKTTLYIERESVEDLIKFEITRDIIKIESISSKILKENIGYIKIKSFQSNTFEQFKDSLDSLRKKGISSIILDLRGNPGGLFNQAIKISNIFLEKNKLIVSTKSKKRNMSMKFFTTPSFGKKFYGPIIVLVDKGSASASEIVAGALKNNERSLIIGEKTFGKGTVQEIYEQSDGSAIKLTIAEYLNPKDYKVHLNGVYPDINFIPADFKNGRLIIAEEIASELNNVGLNQKLNIIYSPKEKETDEDDELIKFSQEILNSENMKKFSFNGNIKNFLSLNENELSIKARKISNSLVSKISGFKIKVENKNFKNAANYENLNLQINPKIELDSGKKELIVAKIKNGSSEGFFNLILITSSENKYLNNKYFFLGALKPKENRKFKMEISIPNRADNSNDLVKFSLSSFSMHDPLRPSLTSITEVNSNITIKKAEFIFPKFTYLVIPKKNSQNNIELELNIKLNKVSKNCDECYIRIFSQDKSLIIKNKNHKISSVKKGSIVVKSNLSLEDKLYSDYINFSIIFHDESSNSFFDKAISIPFGEISSFVKFDPRVDYRLIGKNLLFSDPGIGSIISGKIAQGNLITAIGETNKFLLIGSEDKTLYWIPKSETLKVKEEEKELFLKSKIISQYEEPPTIDIKTKFLEKENTIEVESSIHDETNLKNVNYFINGKKIRLVSRKSKNINESFGLQLDSGRNKLSIIAIDQSNIKIGKNLFITNYEE